MNPVRAVLTSHDLTEVDRDAIRIRLVCRHVRGAAAALQEVRLGLGDHLHRVKEGETYVMRLRPEFEALLADFEALAAERGLDLAALALVEPLERPAPPKAVPAPVADDPAAGVQRQVAVLPPRQLPPLIEPPLYPIIRRAVRAGQDLEAVAKFTDQPLAKVRRLYAEMYENGAITKVDGGAA